MAFAEASPAPPLSRGSGVLDLGGPSVHWALRGVLLGARGAGPGGLLVSLAVSGPVPDKAAVQCVGAVQLG